MTSELVSIITRTKDRPGLLEEAMASVAAQTYQRIEHIVVNDGGADVRAIVEKPSRISTLYIDAGTVGRCRAGNLGLQAASGRFIGWLDDDDLYYPEHLSTLVRAMEESGARVAYSDANKILQNLDPATGAYRDVSTTVAAPFEYSKIALWRRGDLHLVTVLHDRECTDRLGGLDETLPVLEDLELFARFAQDYAFHHVSKVTAAFRVRDDNTNAVTSMRQEFVHTRELLYKRYAHIVMPELLTMVEFGALELAAVQRRVAVLEETVKRLAERDG